MTFLKMSDFCRKFNIPQHRFSRYKDCFAMIPMEGYSKPWVLVNEYNQAMVKEILSIKGTRPKKERLTYEAYKSKYNLTVDHFQKVWHRLHLEEQDGKMMIVDSKQNHVLLKHGRLYRKKS
jgi:hypothetical protein